MSFAHNRIPNKDLKTPYTVTCGRASSLKIWPGDRVAFKPRGVSLPIEHPSSISKLLVCKFQFYLPGKKALVVIATPKDWMGAYVAKEELK